MAHLVHQTKKDVVHKLLPSANYFVNKLLNIYTNVRNVFCSRLKPGVIYRLDKKPNIIETSMS